MVGEEQIWFYIRETKYVITENVRFHHKAEVNYTTLTENMVLTRTLFKKKQGPLCYLTIYIFIS